MPRCSCSEVCVVAASTEGTVNVVVVEGDNFGFGSDDPEELDEENHRDDQLRASFGAASPAVLFWFRLLALTSIFAAPALMLLAAPILGLLPPATLLPALAAVA